MEYKFTNGLGIAVVAVFFLAINQINCQHDRDIVLSPNITHQHPGKIIYYNPVKTVPTTKRSENATTHAQQDDSKVQVNGRLGEMRDEETTNSTSNDTEQEDHEIPWVEVLKHITFMVLSDKVDKYGSSQQLEETSNNETESNRQMKKQLQNAEYRPSYSLVSKFGDIVTLARGKLEQTPKGEYVFIELDSSGCLHNCGEEKNLLKNVTAYWMVEKIRHKDVKRGHRFELRVTIYPIKKGTDSKRDIQIKVKSRTFLLKDTDYPKYFKDRPAKYQQNPNRRFFDFGSLFAPSYDELNIPFHVNDPVATPYHGIPLNTGEIFARPYTTNSLIHEQRPYFQKHNTIESKYSTYHETPTQGLVRFPNEENDHHYNLPTEYQPNPPPVTTMHLHHHYHRLPPVVSQPPSTLPTRYGSYFPLDYRGVPSPTLPEQTEKYVEPQQHLHEHEDLHQSTLSNIPENTIHSSNPPKSGPTTETNSPPREIRPHYYDKISPFSEHPQHQYNILNPIQEDHTQHYDQPQFSTLSELDHYQNYHHPSSTEQHHKNRYNTLEQFKHTYDNQLSIPPPSNSHPHQHHPVSQPPFVNQMHVQIATPPRQQYNQNNEHPETTLQYNNPPFHQFPANYPNQLFAPNRYIQPRQNHRQPRPQHHLPQKESSSVETPPHKEFRPSPEFDTNKFSDPDPNYHFLPTIRSPHPTISYDIHDPKTETASTEASPENTSPMNEEDNPPANIITTTKGRYEIIPLKVQHLDVTERYNPTDGKVELDVQEEVSTHRPHAPDSINAQLPPPDNSDEFTVPYVDTSLKSIKTASPEATRSTSIAEYIPSSNESDHTAPDAITSTTTKSRKISRQSLTPRPPTTTPTVPISQSSNTTKTTEQTTTTTTTTDATINNNSKETIKNKRPTQLKRRRQKLVRTSTEMPVLKWMPKKIRQTTPKPKPQMVDDNEQVAESAVSPSTLDAEVQTRQSVATSVSFKIGSPSQLRSASKEYDMSLEDKSITDSGINRLAKTIIERARRID